MVDGVATGSLITACAGIVTLIVHKVKCAYRRTEEGCAPACACMDRPLEDNDEIEVHKIERNSVELLYVSKKT